MLNAEREQISVLAVFRDGIIEPRRFKKGGRVYDIASINLRHELKQGSVEVLCFSIFDGSQTHRLIYETHTYRWYEEEEDWT